MSTDLASPRPALCLFGDFTVADAAGRALRLPTRKAALLLAYVATAPQARVRRERLCRTFWPDRAEPQARNSLRQTLSGIRKVLSRSALELLAADTDHVWVVDPGSTVDCVAFESVAGRTDPTALCRAADLYRSDFLADFSVPPGLEHWLRDTRLRYRLVAGEVAERLSRTAANGASREAEAVRRLAAALLAEDDTDEPAHRALIRLFQLDGKLNEARRQFELCRAAVARTFASEPEAETVGLIGQREPEVSHAAPAKPDPELPDREDEWFDCSAAGARPSIVVLPFDDLANEGREDFFADGVVEEITAALSRVGDFFVIARQTAIAFRDTVVPLGDICKRLGVRYAVEGTVRRGGPLVRLHVHLVDARTSRQIWSDRFEGRIEDVFALQDDIAVRVAAAISPTVRAAEIMRARFKPPEDRKAYDLVLAGMPKLWSHDADENAAAARLFEQALALTPDYGRAAALLAWCHAQDVVYFWSSDPDRSRRLVLEWVGRAIPLIDDDPTALAAVGAAVSQSECDQDRALDLLARALAIDPNNAWAWARSGWSHYYSGAYDEARTCFETAKRLSPLDPLSFNLEFGLAGILFVEGRYAEAANLCRRTIANKPGITWAYRQYAVYAAHAGHLDEARAAIARYLEAYPEVTIDSFLSNHPQRNNPDYMKLYREGLRLAGLPGA